MRGLLREPLLHFILLGALLFAVYEFLSPDPRSGGTAIVVTEGRIDNLIALFARTQGRLPTPQELDGLIRDYVREEAAVREATALGLDRDDTVIRRRLRQKLEFVAAEPAAPVEPGEDQLREYFASRADVFTVEPRFTFVQVFVNPARRGEATAADADRILVELQAAGASADPAAFGDPTLLGERFTDLPASDAAAMFGAAFARSLASAPVGAWSGPLESGYGKHLVLLQARSEGGLPPFEAVREAVRREWLNARRVEAYDRFYAALLERYPVVMEGSASDRERGASSSNP